jgi:tRNA-specific 2-thiouridylase
MRCLALFTGGLDSQIAVRLMQRQGIEVVGVCVQSAFSFSQNVRAVAAAAERLQIKTHLEMNRELLQLVKRPRFGLAAEMAPCLDCRIDMVGRVRKLMEPLGASFIISGEVVGQRPSSLRSRDLETIAFHGDADDLLLRPLSAQILPPTLPERNGWVDRSQLFGWQGRGHREQLQIAREWNLSEAPGHVSGCHLLDATFAARLRRTLLQNPEPPVWQISALHCGRHFWSDDSHLVLAKNQTEAEMLNEIQSASDAHCVILQPANFRGPTSLLIGSTEERSLLATAAVIARFSKDVVPGESALTIGGKLGRTLVMPRQIGSPPAAEFAGLND